MIPQQLKSNIAISLALSSFATACALYAEEKRVLISTVQSSVESSKPPQFFIFASDIGNGAEAISVQTIDKIHAQYGKNILIGLDSGCIEDNEAEAILSHARSIGARLHVYLEGPGGITGDAWEKDELQRIKQRAQAEGIDVEQPEKQWLSQWNKSGWKSHTYKQLKEYKAQGFESAEIDNLYNGIAANPEEIRADEYITFFIEYKKWFDAGEVPRLMLKNVEPETLEMLVQEIKIGNLSREMFADFHIAEAGSGNKQKQSSLSAQIGIKTAHTSDTHHYHARSVYDLKSK